MILSWRRAILTLLLRLFQAHLLIADSLFQLIFLAQKVPRLPRLFLERTLLDAWRRAAHRLVVLALESGCSTAVQVTRTWADAGGVSRLGSRRRFSLLDNWRVAMCGAVLQLGHFVVLPKRCGWL